jgi:hypothetical protein
MRRATGVAAGHEPASPPTDGQQAINLSGSAAVTGGKRFAVFHPTAGFNFAALQAAPAARRGASKDLASTQERGSHQNNRKRSINPVYQYFAPLRG